MRVGFIRAFTAVRVAIGLLSMVAWSAPGIAANDGPWPQPSELIGKKGRCAAGDERQRVEQLLTSLSGFGAPNPPLSADQYTVLTVTSRDDYEPHEPPVEGTLRAIIAQAVKNPRPYVISFDPGIFGEGSDAIQLRGPLTLPANTILDGSCADVRLEATSWVGMINIKSPNVIVTRLSLRKTDYEESVGTKNARSCIRMDAGFDAVNILYNDLAECGDGAVDITIRGQNRVPKEATATVAFNLIANHDKVSLIGTPSCPDGTIDKCSVAERDAFRAADPSLRVTFFGNYFYRTSQRHPKIYGSAFAEVANNAFLIEPSPRPTGEVGATYVAAAIQGGRLAVDQNVALITHLPGRRVPVFLSDNSERHVPNSDWGHVAVGKNLFLPAGPDSSPTFAGPEPHYTAPKPFKILPLANLPLDVAVRCVAKRAGRNGAVQWDRGCG